MIGHIDGSISVRGCIACLHRCERKRGAPLCRHLPIAPGHVPALSQLPFILIRERGIVAAMEAAMHCDCSLTTVLLSERKREKTMRPKFAA